MERESIVEGLEEGDTKYFKEEIVIDSEGNPHIVNKK